MHHVFVGGPIGRIKSLSIEVNNTQLTDLGPGFLYRSGVSEIADAIRAGRIEGDVYSDGDIYAEPHSLQAYFDANAEAVAQ